MCDVLRGQRRIVVLSEISSGRHIDRVQSQWCYHFHHIVILSSCYRRSIFPPGRTRMSQPIRASPQLTLARALSSLTDSFDCTSRHDITTQTLVPCSKTTLPLLNPALVTLKASYTHHNTFENTYTHRRHGG